MAPGPQSGQKPRPTASVFVYLSPSGHVFNVAWQAMIKTCNICQEKEVVGHISIYIQHVHRGTKIKMAVHVTILPPIRNTVGIAQPIGVLRLVDIYWKSITRKSRLISRIYCVRVSIDSRADTPSLHYNDVMMSAIASRITSLTIVYSTVCARRRSKKTSKIRVTGLCEGIHR